ncbi:MAG: hypothetical protein U9N04_04940 [Patescibacteria group bacterium]|nr:hypothetical protein [Patescibacteria group bacterium]
MKKEIAKRKIKQKKKQQKYQGETIYFEIILMIILIPTIVLFLVPIFQKPLFENTQRQLPTRIHKIASKNSVEIVAEKNIYRAGDEIVLSIKNNSNSSIYFEPCEYLNNFEKKVNGVWVDESSIVKNKIYDSNNFRKGENVTSCRLNLPKLGIGIYRVVVKVYYNCQMPGEATCSDSKTFYSNEFRIY